MQGKRILKSNKNLSLGNDLKKEKEDSRLQIFILTIL